VNTSLRALLIAALLAPAAARAELTLRPAAGLSFNDFSRDPASGQSKGRVGWQAGGTVLLGEGRYLEVGAFYARRSAQITATGGGLGAQDVKFDGLSGLRVPVALGFHVLGAPRDPFAVRLFGGGSAFFVTSVEGSGLPRSAVKSPSYGLFAGAGLDVLIFFADLKYEWSLTELSKLSTIDVGASRSLFLNVGVKLPL
jgi:hypothetical protein